VAPNYSHALPADVEIPQSGQLLRNVHSLYHNQFRRWFGIMAPTSLLAGVVLMMSNQKIGTIFRSIPRSELQYHLGDVALIGLLRFGSVFLSWLLGCFAFAAIATAIEGQEDGESGWRHDSFERAREHLTPLFVVALITFLSFGAGMIVLGLVEMAAAKIVGWVRFGRVSYVATIVGCIVVASVVSWLGAAIPLTLQGNTKLRTALKRSIELSNGYEGALFLLVLESIVGGLIAWYVTLHGLSFLAPDKLRYTDWYGWLANLVAVMASAAVDPPLFIGLCLVADPKLSRAASLPGTEQAPYI
jgi:hypothetical protein